MSETNLYDVAGMILAVKAVLVLIVLLLLWTIITWWYPKTRRYRKSLVDMYVAAKIRKIAKAEDIDLDGEIATFLKLEKHENKFMKDYDDNIEQELSDRIEKDFEKSPTMKK